jgi:hypothetical protein
MNSNAHWWAGSSPTQEDITSRPAAFNKPGRIAYNLWRAGNTGLSEYANERRAK